MIEGYGSMGFFVAGRTRTFLAHRISYFLEHGEQPGEALCHRCDNHACIRPDHLFSGTLRNNVADRIGAGGKRIG